jgi:uroporphyrinogen decarboxylase
MTPNCLTRLAASAAAPLAVPLAAYPATALTGRTVRDMVTDPVANAAAQQALHERYRTPVVLTAMDLSVEAEAFGSDVFLSDTEVPTIVGSLVTSLEQARALTVPHPGDRRTAVALDTVRLLRRIPGRPLVLGGSIGPFSLAARLLGVSEALELTLAEPLLIHAVLEKAAAFLAAYADAFRTAGADGLIMAEPCAGLLSPRGATEFSSAYIRPIVRAVEDGHFAVVLHNCGARLPHLQAVLEAGASVVHFGAAMDMAGALSRVSPEIVVCGNLDPVRTFVQATVEDVEARVRHLLDAAGKRSNFLLSSGCDIPPEAPLANLDAFYQAARWP